MRAAIIDVLEVLGPATVVQVADSLGYPPDGLYYHFAMLQRNGLVVRAEPEPGSGAARFQLPGHPATLRYRLDDARQQTATAKVVATMVRSAERSFRRAFAPGLATVEGPRRNLRAGRADYRTFRVREVLEDSPATEAGVREGDVITSIDGVPAEKFTLTLLLETLQKPAAQHLIIRRGDESVKLVLTPRRML